MSRKSLREKAGRLLESDAKRLSRKSNETYRAAIRALVGNDGAELWACLADIVKGKAWVPRLADGREGPPQVPSTADRKDAAIYLANALFGKPVAQSEVLAAEAAAAASEDFRQLSDDDLKKMVLEGLEGAELRLPAKGWADAEFTEEGDDE